MRCGERSHCFVVNGYAALDQQFDGGALSAGQAVVQFVRALQNNHHYAVKLFASRAAYDDEKHLYLHYFPKFMPTVIQFVDNEDEHFCDPKGAPMPPCFVMEKGESLTERTMRCKNDIFTIIQARPAAACSVNCDGK